MSEINPYGLYVSRMKDPNCYVEWQGIVAQNVNDALLSLGYPIASPQRDVSRIGHTCFIFRQYGQEDGDIVALPWHINPTARERAYNGGRHPLVVNEFFDAIGRGDCREFMVTNLFGRDYVGTYNVQTNKKHFVLTHTSVWISRILLILTWQQGPSPKAAKGLMVSKYFYEKASMNGWLLRKVVLGTGRHAREMTSNNQKLPRVKDNTLLYTQLHTD